MTAPDVAAPRTGPSPKPGFRPDIQGLRAIAVMLVVLFHSGVAALSGGYVGVDVFFVISGFLITTHLLETLERDGRISFSSFYAKRARRILPAALLVAALTLVAAWIWMSPLLMRKVVDGAIATALYGPNYFFALQDTDYLAETTPSVYQHYWSLGIEEQFYLFWPALLAVGFWLCRRREQRVMALIAVVTALSFLACVVLMNISQPWAFFSLPTRAWELGAGGLVAFLLRSGARWLHSRFTGLLAWAGLAGLAMVALTFDGATVFPGWVAALPVLATAAMIIGGAAPGPLNATRLLGLAPLQFLGAISYSLYLVHWPLQVIPQAATFSDAPLPLEQRLALGAVAVPLAWLLYRCVERPVIGWRVLRQRRQWLTGLVAAGASFAVVVSSGAVAAVSAQQPLSTDRTAAPATATLDPAGTSFVPANIAPSLDAVAEDNPAVYGTGCHTSTYDSDPAGCRVGDSPEAPLVFLVGDSHAASWFPALETLAKEGRIRLDSNSKSSCLPLDTEQQYLAKEYTSCEQWRDGVLERIDDEQPDLVLLAMYDSPDRLQEEPGTPTHTQWQQGLAATLEQIDGPRVAVMKDVPTQARNPDECLSTHLEEAQACAVPREQAFKESLVEAEDQAIEEAGDEAARVDLTRYFCNAQTCPLVIGNTVVFRDTHHLTETFSRQMAEPLWKEIEPLVG
ncbi:acyltransferase family protein [Brachybacterium vulturis]|uniref:acyltransferase family protein n=1 Tax=Brachybacterium vulturis TaxID=2017484 RepID=UPI001FEAF611|nr:acyltransferase family protein [Brachybacterium vulturis]